MITSRSQPRGSLTLRTRQARLEEWWSEPEGAQPLSFAWLGQAGFAIRWGAQRLVIDPYLSDSLAEKYRGQEFAHVRMMPAPLPAERLRPLDTVLCTHRHSDHMDPGTLPVLAGENPACQFLVPQAERNAALALGLDERRLIVIDAGESRELGEGIRVTAVPAAHETLERDAEGHHRFLGYVLSAERHSLYHSGDTVPFAGLAESLQHHAIDVALLPVNGRDAFRRERGVPGNMTFAEAAELCQQLQIPVLVPHHFEMFAFNTVDRASLRRQAEGVSATLQCVLPETGVVLQIAREGDAHEGRH